MAETIATILVNFAILGGLIFFMVAVVKRQQKNDAAFKAWAESRGFTFLGTVSGTGIREMLRDKRTTHEPPGFGLSSYRDGRVERGVQGMLPTTRNHFYVIHQTETRGSGKSKQTYFRTVASMQVPDTRLHLVINSKLNDDQKSGGNLTQYASMQRYSPEGDFGKYFDVYLPTNTQSEAFSLLAPDDMYFIMSSLADFDIELNGSYLFVYTYKHMSTSELDELLPKFERLLDMLRLKPGDTRQSHDTGDVVALTARPDAAHRQLKKLELSKAWLALGIFLTLAFLALRIAFEVIPKTSAYYEILAIGSLTVVVSFILVVYGFIARHKYKTTKLRRQYKDTVVMHHRKK